MPKELQQNILEHNNNSQKVSISFDNLLAGNEETYRPISNLLDFTSSQNPADLSDIIIPVTSHTRLTISNTRIDHLRFHGKIDSSVFISDCWIRMLDSNIGQINLTTHNVNIGHIRLHPGMIQNLDAENCWVLSLSCPEPEKQSPFSGNITLRNVHGPRTWRDARARSDAAVQPWTNARVHLAKMNNFRAASVFHASELSLERETEPSWVSRVVGEIYEYTSDYGNSIARSLGWLGAIWAVLLLIYWICGATIPSPDGRPTAGWRAAFVGSEWCNHLARAAWLASQPIVDPLGGLTGRTPVEPSNLWWYGVNVVHRITSAVLIFLTLLSIRRRFRMSSA